MREAEREVEKQKEVGMMYRKRMERTQDYLRYCLQVAQDNGFLDLIIHNKDAPHSQSNIIMNAISSPQFPTPAHHHSHHLASLIIQANLNGWCIAAHEVHSTI